MIYEKIKLYTDREDVTLTSYVHSDSSKLLNGKNRGAVLICPGGSYLYCSDREGEPVALRFASMGYHAFVLRYSTYLEGRREYPDPAKPIPVNKRSIFPNPLIDIAKAMLYIRQHAESWLIDTDKIALCGFSAGAHNCAMYSVYWNTPILTQHVNVEPEQLKPSAAILGYMVSDYLLQKEFALHISDPAMKNLFKMSIVAYTGKEEPNNEILQMISPVYHVSEYTPPMFLWATAEDGLVPAEHTLRMANALAQKNIPFEVHIFEQGPHGLSLANQSTSGSREQINQHAAKWVDLAEEWLLKRFALELPEKQS